MPELPEVQALADFLRARTDGLVVTGVELGSFHVLKTFTPPPEALVGAPVDGVGRLGKFIDLDCGGTHLVFHLARAGWLRWSDAQSATRLRPGKSPIALRVRFDDGSGFDLTEAGTQKRLAAYIVGDTGQVPGIASLGPDPLADEFTEEVFAAILGSHRMQVKGLLRDQSIIAGVGNAYSDEILHVAKLSPFALAATLDAEQVTRLYTALRQTLAHAVATASGKPAKELKDAKRAGMRVHGRTGEVCPECGDVVREVSFADSSLQYCATCQTGGKPLADRRTSKFLK
ncbi:Fpg/Nei family DNA glycosylase [Phycicoccus duodecadis]|uniref:Formamidopyrimidine-DNA glycosylase n=1 Tax=Phycicoccus duodecadis TaxID=173053 RepID=A0A2N3YJE2_9MICO|nr:DNA-formamidopyrimidine glycosylase family protein [Phycicoccus duodecadis]PKW26965.1 formamidopyrimidine-DNA glycosylase [Phycicoccus duodecadis]